MAIDLARKNKKSVELIDIPMNVTVGKMLAIPPWRASKLGKEGWDFANDAVLKAMFSPGLGITESHSRIAYMLSRAPEISLRMTEADREEFLEYVDKIVAEDSLEDGYLNV